MVDNSREDNEYPKMDDRAFKLLASKLINPRGKKSFGFTIGGKQYMFVGNDPFTTVKVVKEDGYKLIVAKLLDGKIIRIESVEFKHNIVSVLIS